VARRRAAACDSLARRGIIAALRVIGEHDADGEQQAQHDEQTDNVEFHR